MGGLWPGSLRTPDAPAFVALLLAIVWAPWPLGSNRPWALGLLAGWVWLALLGLAAVRAQQGRSQANGAAEPAAALPPAVALPLACLAGFSLLALGQWALRGLPSAGLSTIDAFATQNFLLTTLLYAGAWLLVLLTVRSSARATVLLVTIVGAAMLQAFAAVALQARGGSYYLFFTKFDQGARAMGTFPNADHLAGYMGLGLCAGVGFLLAGFAGKKEQRAAGWRGNAVGFLSFALSAKMLVRVLMVSMVVALVMTHSRMGNGAFFIALLLGGSVIATFSQVLRRPALWLVASMLIVDVVVIGQWVGLDRVAQRLSDTVEASVGINADGLLEGGLPPRETSLAQRLEVPRQSLALVAEKPWFGHGGGTYYTAFPPHKQPGYPWHWNYAHNDYVQVAADMGLVGLALWLGIGVSSGWRALQLLKRAKEPIAQGLGAAVLLSLCCLGLHTLVDFNLQIPANALTFSVLLAAVWAVPTSGGRRRRSGSSSRSGGR